jgi:hypothetical protein
MADDLTLRCVNHQKDSAEVWGRERAAEELSE